VEHGAATALGMRAHARAVAEWAEDELGGTGDVLVMQAWGPATIGRDDAARERLRGVLDGSVACVVHWLHQEAQLLDCAMALHSGATSRAWHALERAVALAAATATLRPLIGAPPRVGALLAERAGHFGARDALVRDVLRLRAARGLRPNAPLTEREREVLDLLPTQLSLDEIAEALSVSINTVRTHVRSLHGKLGVTSRADTVLVAAQNGLIGVRAP
jgi:LuxR family maltose regulon positive regulatory protein